MNLTVTYFSVQHFSTGREAIKIIFVKVTILQIFGDFIYFILANLFPFFGAKHNAIRFTYVSVHRLFDIVTSSVVAFVTFVDLMCCIIFAL